MGVAFSLVLFAIGAIFTFAVNAHPSGLSIQAVGVILMTVAVIGFAVALYREGWRRRLVEDSIDHGVEPDVTLDDDGVIIETVPRGDRVDRPDHVDHVEHVDHEIVREHVIPADEPVTVRRRS
jgi:hypothetical protein